MVTYVIVWIQKKSVDCFGWLSRDNKEDTACDGSLRDNVFVCLFLYPCQVYCELNLQREAGLYYSNKLPRMRRALVRAWCMSPPPPLPSLPQTLSRSSSSHFSSSLIMFFWADKCVLPAKPVAISRRATQPLGATSDRADIDGGWMSASGGGGSTSKRWPVLVPSVIHHTYPPSAAGWLRGMAKIKKVDVTRQWEWRSSPAKLSILVGGSSSAQITLNFLIGMQSLNLRLWHCKLLLLAQNLFHLTIFFFFHLLLFPVQLLCIKVFTFWNGLFNSFCFQTWTVARIKPKACLFKVKVTKTMQIKSLITIGWDLGCSFSCCKRQHVFIYYYFTFSCPNKVNIEVPRTSLLLPAISFECFNIHVAVGENKLGWKTPRYLLSLSQLFMSSGCLKWKC